jgi:NADH-quinone oxidoreductase subunit J
MLAPLGTALFLAADLVPDGVPRGLSILILCIVAGIGTAALLPAPVHPGWRRIGGTLLVVSALAFLATLVGKAGQTAGPKAHTVYFWIFSAVALFSAARVVTHPRPVYSALYFVLAVFATAGLFVLLLAEFMAAALVIIYAGAILVTYVFVIMLAVQSPTGDAAPTASQQMSDYDAHSRDPFIASAIGFALMGVLLFVILDRAETPYAGPSTQGVALQNAAGAPKVEGDTQTLGVYLFSSQQLSLELAGLLLTIAMVGAIVIARRRVLRSEPEPAAPAETVTFPATPVNDDPHSIPVYGTDNPRQKAYPET